MPKHTEHGKKTKLSNMEYEITLYTTYKKYTTFVKTFTSEQHMTNWTNVMNKKGHKVINLTKLS